METGPNEGVGAQASGIALVTIDGVGALFAVDVDDFSLGLSADLVETTGPADAVGDKVYRAGDAGGQWSGRGRVRGDKRPMPLRLNSASGKMRVAMTAAADGDGHTAAVNYYDFAAVFNGITFSHAPTDQNGEEVWNVRFTVTKTGPLTPAWNTLDLTAEGTLTPARTLAYKEIWNGRAKNVDPAGLESSAQSVFDIVGAGIQNSDEVAVMATIAAAATGAAVPATGLKVVRQAFSRIDGLGARGVLSWDYDDAADRVVNGGQMSAADLIASHDWTSVEILDTSSDPETVLAAELPGFQAQAFARSIRVQKLNRFKAAITRTYRDPGVSISSHTQGEPDYQIARVSGGNVQVLVRQALQQGTGLYKLLLGRSYKRRVSRRFKVRRYLSGTTIPDHATLIGGVNNATFLGLSAGGVMYLACDVDTNIGLTTPYQFAMDYLFEWFSGGFYEIEGWTSVVATSAAVSAGWVNVSSLTASGITGAVPATGDFSVFLA